MKSWFQRIRDGLRRRRVVTRFDEEIAFHREQLEIDYRNQGLSPEEASFAALRDLGNLVQSREAIRERTGLPVLEEFGRDLATAFRGLAKRKLFSLSVVVILAVGLGAASVVHGLAASRFLRPLKVPKPAEIYTAVSNPDGKVSRGTVARTELNLGSERVGGYSDPNRVSVVLDGRKAVSVEARLVTGSFFTTLRLRAVAGRLLDQRDDVAGAPGRVVVISHSWAERHFGSADSGLGSSMLVNGQAMEVVGVLPVGFQDISGGGRVDLWFPTALQPVLGFTGNSHGVSADDRRNNPDFCQEERVAWLGLLLRLEDSRVESAGAGVRQAYADQAKEWARALDDPREQNAALQKPWRVLHTPNGIPSDRKQQKAFLAMLGGIVATLLLLSCANVSGLLLVRTMSRHREMGVRLALGAGTWRAIRLVATEALLLCGTAGLIGLLFAIWIHPLTTESPLSWAAVVSEIHFDTIAFSFAAIATCTFLSGIAPIIFITRLEPSAVISGNAAALPRPGRVGRFLVIGQLALTVVLVAVAFSLGKKLERALSQPFGFEANSVLTTSVSPPQAGLSNANSAVLKQRIQTALESVAGVEQVAFATAGVMVGSTTRSGIYPRGDKALIPRGHYQNDSVSSGYFSTLGLNLLRGRYFDRSVSPESPRVAVVTATFAKELFGTIDVIGERFGFDHTPSANDWTIIGVVADARINGTRSSQPAMFFVPDSQFSSHLHFIAVRVSGSVETARTALSDAIAAAEPRFSGVRWKTLHQRARDGMGEDRAALSLAGTVAGVALLLAGIGTSASLSYLVLTKRKELAIRLAIGASPKSLVNGVLKEAFRLTAYGAALGFVAIWGLHWAPGTSDLFDGTQDVSVHLAAGATVLIVSLLSAFLPARRAAKTDALVSLKSD